MGRDKREERRGGVLQMTLLLTLSIVITVYSLPKGGVEHYNYTIGSPWTEDALIAPVSFSIVKSDALYQSEVDSVKALFAPYFRRDNSVAQRAIERLDRQYRDTLATLISYHSYALLRGALMEIYDIGVLSMEDYSRLSESRSRYVRHYVGNTSSFIDKEQLLSEKSAYQSLTGIEVESHEKHLILKQSLEQFIEPNLLYDAARSTSNLEELIEGISHYRGVVMAGEKIVGHGEIVDEETAQKIESYVNVLSERVTSKRYNLFTWAGQLLFIGLLYLSLYLYLTLYRRELIESTSKQLFLFISLTLFTSFVGIYVKQLQWSVFLLPVAMLPVIYRVFLDSRTSFMGYMVFVLSSSIVVPMQYEYILLQVAAGLVAIYSLKELSQRSQILMTALLIFLVYSAVWTSLQMIQLESLKNIDYKMFIYFLISSLLLLLLYPLLFLIERVFGFVSNVTLIELSNINHPLLRRLAENAPGTFQHSMQVSALAADAANSVGANVQLVRTAALYHDIGKLSNPPFFVENQNGVNPHDALSPKESAKIITQHVPDGLRIAEQYNLPMAIRAIIKSHHGCGIARYFFIKEQYNKGDNAREEDFRYLGENPTTKEAAILMMADSVEAASRSLSKITEESISGMVDKIIDSQLSEGFFVETPLSYRDIALIRNIFKEKLMIMYHTRISYPEPPKGDQHRN